MMHSKTTNNQHSIAMEGIQVAETVFLAILGAIYIWSQWDSSDKTKKERDEHNRQVKEKFGIVSSELQKTYLNRKWLNDRTFVTGNIAAIEISKALAVNGKMPADALAAVEKSLKTIETFDTSLGNRYSNYVERIAQVVKPVYGRARELSETDPDERDLESQELYLLWRKMDDDLAKITHPLEGSAWLTCPSRDIVGGLVLKNNSNKPSEYLDIRQLDCEFDDSVIERELPALDQEGVMRAAKVMQKILSILEKQQNFLESAFYKCADLPVPQDTDPYQTWNYGFDLIDAYEDAWSKNRTGKDPGFFQTRLFAIGALTDQGHDPLYTLEDAYSEVMGNALKALGYWIKRSISA